MRIELLFGQVGQVGQFGIVKVGYELQELGGVNTRTHMKRMNKQEQARSFFAVSKPTFY